MVSDGHRPHMIVLARPLLTVDVRAGHTIVPRDHAPYIKQTDSMDETHQE